MDAKSIANGLIAELAKEPLDSPQYAGMRQATTYVVALTFGWTRAKAEKWLEEAVVSPQYASE